MGRVIKAADPKPNKTYLFVLRMNEKVVGTLLNNENDILLVDTSFGVRELFKNNIYFFKEIVSN